ncbi:hypothetical protein ABE288_20200 [Bacillus salipaludis]|uniref:hypothetical protein n=1 Tax=Bacillus salipaludis TaxID=2547811 RepID=UPI003D1A1B97
MSFMNLMEDKNGKGKVENVLHKAVEGQKSEGMDQNVLHKAVEGQKSEGIGSKCPT